MKRNRSSSSTTPSTSAAVQSGSGTMNPHSGDGNQAKMDSRGGGFLERCYYCQKRIGRNAEVFMYGDLCAFCSSECRNFQIAKDRLANKQPAN